MSDTDNTRVREPNRQPVTLDLQNRDPLTDRIIACAIEVHRAIGPGLLESTYEEAMCVELGIAGLQFSRQAAFPILYKGRVIGEYRLDLLVQDRVIVEIKSVERFDPIFEAQILTYLRATGKKAGLLINFNPECCIKASEDL